MIATPRSAWLVAALVAVLAVSTACSSQEEPSSVAGPDLGPEFVDRYERFRRASLSYEERVTRVDGERTLSEAPVTVIAAFPEKVSVGEHQITGRVDGRSVGCNDASGDMVCRDNGEIDVAAAAAADIADALDGIGAQPARWLVTAGNSEDCYELTAVSDELVDTWGRRAVLCFDESSGLLVSETVDFEQGRDTVERVLVSDDVDRDDVVAAFPEGF